MTKSVWKFLKRRVYLDYAAATPVSPRVERAMKPYQRDVFGNPSSVHEEGVAASRALARARGKVARALRARAEEIIFTSGGTESNNLALQGIVEAARRRGTAYTDLHIITSKVEHVSVLMCVRRLEERGVRVTYVPVNNRGLIEPEQVVRALRSETLLISLMYVNNEIGTIMPLRAIVTAVEKACAEKGFSVPLFHSDVGQAPLFLDCSPERLQVDMLSLDSPKMYGPKGVGILFRKHTAKIAPLMEGGGQEYELRPGTEAVPLIVGFAEALVSATEKRVQVSERIQCLRDYFLAEIERRIPSVIVNGDRKQRIANNVNITIPGTDMEFLVIQLDHEGIAVSAASACRAGEGSSHVLTALSGDAPENAGAVRFSLGYGTTRRDIDRTLRSLEKILKN